MPGCLPEQFVLMLYIMHQTIKMEHPNNYPSVMTILSIMFASWFISQTFWIDVHTVIPYDS